MVNDKETINRSLTPKLVDARVAQVFNTFKKVLVTSSFGTTSAVLLHIVSRVKPECPIYFIDTGYLFKETLVYKNQLIKMMNLTVIDLHPDSSRHQSTKDEKLWKNDPDKCCQINKIEPLEQIKDKFSIWMSGLIGYQSSYRSSLDIINEKMGIMRCYPLIDWNKDTVEEYMELYGLPSHPLKEKGYASVGCTHCTVPAIDREGRWNQTEKTECGLHR